jgi:hypothetical protein
MIQETPVSSSGKSGSSSSSKDDYSKTPSLALS